jgi:hypothetical protein
MERAKRFELSTPTLARLCSTTELRPPIREIIIVPFFQKFWRNGAGEEIRTLDPNLGKVVLYH